MGNKTIRGYYLFMLLCVLSPLRVRFSGSAIYHQGTVRPCRRGLREMHVSINTVSELVPACIFFFFLPIFTVVRGIEHVSSGEAL